QDLGSEHPRIHGTAASGARRAVWIPVHFGQHLHGILFAASSNPLAKFPIQQMERAASELALVFGFRRETALAQAKTMDLAEIAKFCSEIALTSGHDTSYDRILQQITTSCLYSGRHRAQTAVFATIGVGPDHFRSSHLAKSQIAFR